MCWVGAQVRAQVAREQSHNGGRRTFDVACTSWLLVSAREGWTAKVTSAVHPRTSLTARVGASEERPPTMWFDFRVCCAPCRPSFIQYSGSKVIPHPFLANRQLLWKRTPNVPNMCQRYSREPPMNKCWYSNALIYPQGASDIASPKLFPTLVSWKVYSPKRKISLSHCQG